MVPGGARGGVAARSSR